MIHMMVQVGTDDGSDKKHEGAGGVDVRDGHLFVLSATGADATTVAVYAPARWRRAEVKDEDAKS